MEEELSNMENVKIRTYEELVWDKIVKLSEAKEAGNKFYFDEILDELEMLFRLVPKLSNALDKDKEELISSLKALKAEVNNYTNSIEDEITKQIIHSQKMSLLEWDYRSDMLESVLMILNEEQMIPFTNPLLGEMGSPMEEVADFVPDESDESDFDEPVPQKSGEGQKPSSPPPQQHARRRRIQKK